MSNINISYIRYDNTHNQISINSNKSYYAQLYLINAAGISIPAKITLNFITSLLTKTKIVQSDRTLALSGTPILEWDDLTTSFSSIAQNNNFVLVGLIMETDTKQFMSGHADIIVDFFFVDKIYSSMVQNYQLVYNTDNYYMFCADHYLNSVILSLPTVPSTPQITLDPVGRNNYYFEIDSAIEQMVDEQATIQYNALYGNRNFNNLQKKIKMEQLKLKIKLDSVLMKQLENQATTTFNSNVVNQYKTLRNALSPYAHSLTQNINNLVTLKGYSAPSNKPDVTPGTNGDYMTQTLLFHYTIN
jgi:hypothetical protein